MCQSKKLHKIGIIAFIGMMLFFTSILVQPKQTQAASGKYLIKVNKQMNCVTIYKRDNNGKYTIPYKSMICSTGNATPEGTFRTGGTYRWLRLMGDVWGQYCTVIKGDYLFHSVYYLEKKDPSKISVSAYNKLGTTCSHGCVRLTVEDAKWIATNCGSGTTVVIYKSSKAGPLGRPEAIKLKSGAGYDPTDTDNVKNPFNSKKPTIKASNKSVKYGSKVNLKSGVTAKNTTGFDITSRIKVSGSVNTKKIGTYKVTYKVTDELGRSAKKTVTYTVKKPTITISGVGSRVFKKGTKVNSTLALKYVSAKFNGTKIAKSKITATVKRVAKTPYYEKYQVTYKFKFETETRTRKCTFSVDQSCPFIYGVKTEIFLSEAQAKEYIVNNQVTRSFTLKGISVKDNSTRLTTSDVTVSTKKNSNSSYTVTYSVKDKAGNKTTKKTKYTIVQDVRLVVEEQTLENDVVLTNEMALSNVKVFVNGVNYTKQWISDAKVTISELTNEEEQSYYTVTYSISMKGKTATASTKYIVQNATITE